MKKLLRDILFCVVGGFLVIGIIVFVLSGIVLLPLMTAGIYTKFIGPLSSLTGSVWLDKWIFGVCVFFLLIILGNLIRFFHYTGKDFLRFMK